MTEEKLEVAAELAKKTVMMEHTTFVRSNEEFLLKRCEDEDCMCGKVHCPFCNTDHYKPTQPARVRDHLNLMHFMHAVHYEGMIIVKCFRECTPGIAAGHYHCPHCERQIGKRAAFSRHLQGHVEKMGKDVSVVQSPDFKQPGMIVFDGNEIPLCTKVCEDALGKHYHCPLCKTKNFSELGPMMAHLWRCREEGKQNASSPLSTPKPKKPVKKPTPKETPQKKKLHVSIVNTMTDIPVQRCNSETCCDKRYHCPLCTKSKFKPCQAREVRDHFQYHWKARVEYKDLIIVCCNNSCRDRRYSRSVTHYHCPECENIFQGKDQFESHLEKCVENLAAQKSIPAPSPRGRGRPRKSEKKVDEAPVEVEVEVQELPIEEEEAPQPTPKPLAPPPRIARGRPQTMSKDKAILALAESSDDEMEAFDKVTAVISKKIISSLAASTNVEDVLDDVSKNTGITWSWSPGTMEPVYVMSGDLIALVKAKRLLKELKEEYEKQRLKQVAEQKEMENDFEPPLHFPTCDNTSVSASDQIPTDSVTPASVIVVPEQDNSMQGLAENVTDVAQMQTTVPDACTLDDIGSGELHISADEPVNPSAFESIQGEAILTEEMLQQSVIITADSNGIAQLPQVSVEEIPQASVGDLQMGQNFADSLMEAATAELVVSEQVEEATRPSAQLSGNIFQPDSEVAATDCESPMDAETGIIEIPSLEESEVTPKQEVEEPSMTESPEELEKSDDTECLPLKTTIDLDNESSKPETQAEAELQEKIFDDQSVKESEKGDDTSLVKKSETQAVPESKEEKSVKDKPEAVAKSPRKKRQSVPFTPERKYSTRGVKVNFSELHSGKKQAAAVIESDPEDEENDDEDDESENEPPVSSPRRGVRGRGRGLGRGRPPGSGVKRGRGRPPKRGRGRPPKRPRLEVEEEEEDEDDPEIISPDERMDDSDEDPDFVMAEKPESDDDEEEEEEEEEVEQNDEGTPKKRPKPVPPPVEAHIASIPVIRFAGLPRGQKENKEPEDTTLDVFLQSIKKEIIDPEYTFTPRPRRRGRGRGRGGRRRDTFDNYFMDEAFRQHPCLECPFLAESFSGLTDHLIEAHNITDHMRCDICEKSFIRKKHITHHMIMKHGPLPLSDGQVYQHDTEEMGNKCSICGLMAEGFAELTDHYINEHHAYDVLRCDVCEIVFKKARHRTTHIDNIHGPHNRKGTFVCDLCGHSCDKQRSLNWHKSYAHNMSTKKNPDIFYCRKCDFETSEPSEMREHKRTHLEDRKYCDICKKSFSATTDMKTHMQAVHLKTKTYSCDVCDKKFTHWRYLTAHMERHTGEKKHLCNVCGQRFSKAAILREHIETHKVMSERNYKHICPYCDARYYSKDKYMDHLNKHTGEKPHICEECGKGFSFRSMLLKHRIYVHTTDRPFKCDCCDKAFKFKQILKNHMVLHTGESKYICEGCKKPFSCSATLKTHRPKCRGDQSWQKRKSGVAKAVAANMPPEALMLPKQEFQELNQLQLHPQQIQHVQADGTDLQQVHVAVSQANLTQLVDTIVVEMGDGQRSIVDLNSLEAATQFTETDNVAAGIYLCSVCNAMFDTVNAAEEHIAQAHAPGKPDVDEATEKLELEEVMEAEADANITNLISELETKVKAKLDPSMIPVGLKTPQ